MRGGAWGQRSFRLFFFGQGISAVGDRIVSVALAFAVLDLTGSVKDLGIVLAAQTAPLVLFILLGGVWSDRVSRRALMLASDLVRAGAQGASAALLVTGSAHVWQLVILQALYGTAAAFFGPASVARLPQTVAPADLQQANALMAISANTSVDRRWLGFSSRPSDLAGAWRSMPARSSRAPPSLRLCRFRSSLLLVRERAR